MAAPTMSAGPPILPYPNSTPSNLPQVPAVMRGSFLRQFVKSRKAREASQPQEFMLHKEQIFKNVWITPILPDAHSEISDLKGKNQLQYQWRMCAETIASLQVAIKMLAMLTCDLESMYHNTCMLTGIAYTYSDPPNYHANILRCQFEDLLLFAQNRYEYLQIRLVKAVNFEHINRRIPRSVVPLKLTMSIVPMPHTESFRMQFNTIKRENAKITNLPIDMRPQPGNSLTTEHDSDDSDQMFFDAFGENTMDSRISMETIACDLPAELIDCQLLSPLHVDIPETKNMFMVLTQDRSMSESESEERPTAVVSAPQRKVRRIKKYKKTPKIIIKTVIPTTESDNSMPDLIEI